MVAPWGVCLAGLVGAGLPVLVVVGVAYAQLLAATDTVRLVHHGAGPVLTASAAAVIPEQYLILAVIVHGAYWWKVERV
jgi:hypothetical protein